MLKRGLLCAALLVALAVPVEVVAQTTTLLPGVTYERTRILSGGRPVVLHVVRTPPQGDLYKLRPVLSHGNVQGLQTVTGMQGRLQAKATTVGVNGDFFKFRTGESSGVFLRDGVLSSPPNPGRSSLALGLDGLLAVDRLRLAGSWRAGAGGARALRKVNRKVTTPSGVALFSPTWGSMTPRAIGGVEAVVTGIPRVALGADLTGTVTAVARGGRTPIPPGGVVLQALGDARAPLLARATVGAQVTVRVGLDGLPADAQHALGGGPVLVRNGSPVRNHGEYFTLDQLARRHPRTAVGQLANGGYLFVVVDGRSSWSHGLTQWTLARALADLGAVTAMGLDGGGSSTLAFEGKVLNTPSDGRQRRVANGLFLLYSGVFAPVARGTIVSPNGDGVLDAKTLSAKLVRRSDLDLRLLRPDGSVAWSRRSVVGPGWVRRVVSSRGMPDGKWRWIAAATEVGSGTESRMERTFTVNKTLGHLELSRRVLRLGPGRRARLGISVRLTRQAHVTVAVAGARSRRTIFRGTLEPGERRWRWAGRTVAGKLVPEGTYAVRVTAANSIGTVSLDGSVYVRRVPSR